MFAKTDIIHRQQEGVPKEDILLGLCYAMIRNYKATIVRSLPVHKPVVFTGGVTCNAGVIRAIRDVFHLEADELIVPRPRQRLGPPAFVPVLLLISRQQNPPAPALEKALHAGAGGKNVNYSECG